MVITPIPRLERDHMGVYSMYLTRDWCLIQGVTVCLEIGLVWGEFAGVSLNLQEWNLWDFNTILGCLRLDVGNLISVSVYL